MLSRLFNPSQTLNEQAVAEVMQIQAQSNPVDGDWGRVEEIVARLAAQQGRALPKIESPWISVFAADHGAYDEQQAEMPKDLAAKTLLQACSGKAVINQLASFSQAKLEWIDIGVNADLADNESLISAKIAKGTANFFTQAAMSETQMWQGIQLGIDAAERAKNAGADLFIGGEVAAENHISALAMAAALSGKTALQLISSAEGFVSRADKAQAALIDEAITLHQAQLNSPLKILQYLGGFETAALCGAYIRCAQLGLTIIVDGFMASVALWIGDMVSRNDQLVSCDSEEQLLQLGKYSVPETMFCLCGTCPRLVDWSFFAQQSVHPAHAEVLDILAAEPLVKWEMKHSEAMAATMIVPILQQACLLQASLQH